MIHSITRVSKSKKLSTQQALVIWDDECDEDKMEEELLETKTKRGLIRSKSLIFRSSHFHIITIHNKLQNLYFIPYVLNMVSFP